MLPSGGNRRGEKTAGLGSPQSHAPPSPPQGGHSVHRKRWTGLSGLGGGTTESPKKEGGGKEEGRRRSPKPKRPSPPSGGQPAPQEAGRALAGSEEGRRRARDCIGFAFFRLAVWLWFWLSLVAILFFFCDCFGVVWLCLYACVHVPVWLF